MSPVPRPPRSSRVAAGSAYAGTRTVAYSTVSGGLGWLAYLGATGVGMGPVAASSLAALKAGFLSQVGASRLKVPALALSMAAIVPLLPGLAVYGHVPGPTAAR